MSNTETQNIGSEQFSELSELSLDELDNVLDDIPRLLENSDVKIDVNPRRISISIKDELDDEIKEALRLSLFLAITYSQACHEGEQESYFKRLPNSHKEHIESLIDTLKKHENFPYLYYRSTRYSAYLMPSFKVRELVLESDVMESKMNFFELVFRRKSESGEPETMRVEMDNIEIRSLITELKSIIEGEDNS